MCSRQMENAQKDEKKDFLQSYFRNPLIFPPPHYGGKHDLS